MRIPFPERVPIGTVVVFAIVLAAIQGLEGTPLYFSAGSVAFLILAALAFNTGGGLARAAGAYVFFYSVLVVIVGLCVKAVLGERADSNLSDPQTTIEVYVCGMAAMLAAVVVSRRVSRKVPLLKNVMDDAQMYRSCVGCIVFGIGGSFVIALLGSSGARLNSAFTQLNQLVPLAIIIGTVYEVRRSGGTRSVNIAVLIAAVYFFLIYGLMGFSKAGLLTPFFCWLLAVCAFRYRLSHLQVAGCLLGTFLLFQYLVPYSQYGRRFMPEAPTATLRFELALRLLSHPEDTRQHYEAEQVGINLGAHYFNKGEGFFDRLQFISVDDSLIRITDDGAEFGYLPIWGTFLNAVPHVILPNKPSYNFGNLYAHEIGGISEDDVSTGISFSPTAEAYHLGRWQGVLLVAPLIWCALFIVLDSIFGDLRTPYGLLVLSYLSHAAPETALTGAIYVMTTGTIIFVFCAFFAGWIAPVIAVVALGKERRNPGRRVSFRTSGQRSPLAGVAPLQPE